MKSRAILVLVLVAFCDAFSQLTPPYCVNVRCKVKESRRDDFLTLIKDNQARTLEDEPEALQYVAGEDVEEPNVFYIHEEFLTPQGFVFHRGTSHNANWQKFKATDPFEEAPVTNFYNGTHTPAAVPIRDAYCLNVQLCIDPKFRNEFLNVITNNARGSNQEPLCLQYAWGEDCSEPNTFHFHEQYTGSEGGKEGFLAHTKMEHFDVWEKFASQDPFTKPPLVYFYKTI